MDKTAESSTKANTVIIMAGKKGGYVYDGFFSEGYRIYPPYKGNRLGFRILRELCFKIPFLPKAIWFDKKILKENPSFFIIRDSLITVEYLKWINKNFKKAQINYLYENMVGRSRHLHPKQIPEFVRIWTYDGYDSRKYGIQCHNTPYYFPAFVKHSSEKLSGNPFHKKYDLLFVGADKGRGAYVLKLQKYLKKHGYNMKVHITAESRFDRKKKYYKQEVAYSQIVQWLAESRAVLNVTLKSQEGITVRDLESVFHGVKLVTTNKCIVKAPIYKKENVFVLSDNNWNRLLDFLASDYEENEHIKLSDFTAGQLIKKLTGPVCGGDK